jgi:hypothetical protein
VGSIVLGEGGTLGFPLWEYKVIHLNVSDQRGSAGQRSEPMSAGEPSSSPLENGFGTHQRAFPFSRAYLEKEFPGYYSDQTDTDSGKSGTASIVKTPGTQLQEFLNHLGCAGWNLLGIFPVGSHQMLVFSRPITPSKATARAQASNHPRELHSIIEPVEQLEAARSPSQRSDALDPIEALTSTEAAERIGFRALSSLTTPLRQADEPVGFQRLGPNGLVAEYLGIGLPARGGRPCRLWRIKTEAQANESASPFRGRLQR